MIEEDSDTIYEEDKNYLEKDRKSNEMCIGIYNNNNNNYILDSCISSEIFFKYNIDSIKNYLIEYGTFSNENENENDIEILKIDLKNNVYNVILKTHWIRLIQRKWKKIYRSYILEKKSVNFIFSREIGKKHRNTNKLIGLLKDLK